LSYTVELLDSESAALLATEAIMMMMMIHGGRRRITRALEGGAGDRFKLNMLKMLLLAIVITCFPDAIHSTLLLSNKPRHMPILPIEFRCPISLGLMTDPVVASDGCTYERESITRWLSEHNTSPTTNLPLQSHTLHQNRAIRNLIQEWQSGATSCKVRFKTVRTDSETEISPNLRIQSTMKRLMQSKTFAYKLS
jgi:hypothetical protein